MAETVSLEMEQVVKAKVEDEMKSLSVSRKKELTKTVRDVIETMMPEMTKLITVAVSAAVTAAMDRVMEEVRNKVVDSFQVQRQAMLTKYECDKLEQYQRSDNLRIYGMEEEREETEETLEEKVVELASNMGVHLQPGEVSVVHRLGKPRESDRPVIIRFCCRKKRNEFLKKKVELKKKNIKIYINEDLTPLRAAMMKMVKDQAGVKNVTSRNGKIVAWLNDEPNRAIEINTPDDLNKVGIVTPDWKRLKMDHLVWYSPA